MPVIPGTNSYEIDIEIVSSGTTYTLSNGDFAVEGAFLHDMADMEIPNIQIDISLNDVTREFHIMDTFIVSTRETAGDTWLKRFTGFIEQLSYDSKRNICSINAIGREILLKSRSVSFKQYGNTQVEEEELLAATTGLNGMSYEFSLDGSPLSVPLTHLEIHNGKRGCTIGNGSGTDVGIYNDAAGHSLELAIPFYHTGGRLHGFCIKVDKDTSGTVDMFCSIENYNGPNDMSPDGTEILTGALSYDLVSPGFPEWYRIKFTNQDTELAPNWYVAHISHAGSASSTIINPFWLVMTVDSPCEIVMPALTKVNADPWVQDGTCYPLFLPDSENNYKDMEYPKDYSVASNIVTVNMGDSVGLAYSDDMFFGGLVKMSLTRASYWYGTMDLSSTIEDYLQDQVADLVDIINVVVSAPVITVPNVTIKEMTVWEGLMEFRKLAPIEWRMEELLSGTTVLYVSDKLEPTDWAAQSADYKTWHTFKHGHDDSSNDDYVCIVNDSLTKQLDCLANRIFVYNELGDAVYGDRDDGFLVGDFNLDAGVKISGMNNLEMMQMANYLAGQLKTVVVKGEIELSDFSLDTDRNLFKNCNELVNIVDSNTGYNGQYSINRITVDYSNGASVKLNLADKVTKYFQDATRGIMTIGAHGLKGGNQHRGDWVVDDGTVDVPKSGGIVRGNEVLLLKGSDFNDCTYAAGSSYKFQVGIGTPGGGTIGTKVASCTPVPYAPADEAFTYLICELTLSTKLGTYKQSPITVTEVNLCKGAVEAPKTIGTDKDGGGMDIVAPRPKMQLSEGKVTFIIKLANA